MSNTKKEWTRPQLIVLARGTPEEAVLYNCKRIGDVQGPQASVQQACETSENPSVCGACQARAGS